MVLGALAAFISASAAGLELLPKITTQPRIVSASAGRETVLFVRAYGAGQIKFQWLRDGEALTGADEPVLRLSSISAGQAGAYQMVVSSPYGKATSEVARVTVESDNGAGFTPAGVVSCNAVGYVNLATAPGLTLVINQLSPGVGGAAVVSNVLGSLPDGMAIYQVASNGFTANAMLRDWTQPTAPLPFGDIFFVRNPFGFPVTVTLVGEVAQGDLRQALPVGYSVAGSLVPQAGPVGSALQMPVAAGDEVWRWDAQAQSYREFRFPVDVWQPEEPVISIVEAFVVRKETAVIWRRFFTIDFVGSCPTFAPPLTRVPMSSTAGQLHFFTYHPDPELGRVEGAGSDYFGQLYAGLSTNENELSPCGVPVRFFDGERAGYLDGGIVTAPGLPAGRVVQAQLRIWRALDGASYETAQAAGCFTARSELVPARTEAPLVDGRPGKPPRPVNQFRTMRPPQVPYLVIEPADWVVPIGQTVTLSVAGAGAGALGFQWRHDAVDISGANGPQLQLSNVERTDAGEYSVIVSNGACASSSANARLTVYQPIQILEQPADLDRIAGEMARFAVLATGEPPLTYQWRSSVTDPALTNRLPGANSAAFVISSVVDQTEGDYWVEVRSPYESIISSRARLSVTNYLHLALDTPTWLYVTSGDRAWQAAGTAHLGRSNAAVAGPISSPASASMETQIEGPGVLTFWWATTARRSDNSLRFWVDGVPKASLYDAPGWEPASVSLPSGSHRLQWFFRYASPEGQAVTAWVDSVEIRAGVAPAIMSAASNYWFTPGERVHLSVVATGDDPLRYQWFAGADPIPWGTGDILALWPSQIASQIPYTVTVSNYFGAATSGPMMLRPRPRLGIETAPAGTFRLVWPREASEFALEQSAELTRADSWSVVTQAVVLNETNCAVSLPPELGTNRWFRLRSQ